MESIDEMWIEVHNRLAEERYRARGGAGGGQATVAPTQEEAACGDDEAEKPEEPEEPEELSS